MFSKKILSGFIISLLSITSAFAIATPTNFEVSSTTQNSATLTWDTVNDAAAYSLYYGTVSGELKQYDLLETSPYLLTGLTADTTYFMTLSANDDNFEESALTAEISFTTGGSGEAESSFALEDVELLSETKIKLTFNANIDADEDAPREFKIVNKFDDLEELAILDSEIDEENTNMLIITMQSSIPTSAQYNITVVRLNDEDGNNIQNGIDGIGSFDTPNSYEQEEEVVVVEEPIIEEEVIEEELTSAGPEEANTEVSGGSSGQNLSDDELAKTTETTAENAENLPTTGPEHWFLGILAFFLGALMFSYKFSRD